MIHHSHSSDSSSHEYIILASIPDESEDKQGKGIDGRRVSRYHPIPRDVVSPGL